MRKIYQLPFLLFVLISVNKSFCQDKESIPNVFGFWVVSCQDSALSLGNGEHKAIVIYMDDGGGVYDPPFGDLFMYFQESVTFIKADSLVPFSVSCLQKPIAIGKVYPDERPYGQTETMHFQGNYGKNGFYCLEEQGNYFNGPKLPKEDLKIEIKYELVNENSLKITFRGHHFLYHRLDLIRANW